MAPNVNLIPRDPTQDLRQRRFDQIVAGILNPLILAGILNPTGVNTWGMAGLFFTGSGAPAASLGWKGDYYLDLQTGTLWQYQ